MTIKQLKVAIRSAKTVYAYAVISSDDGIYVRVVKSELLDTLKEWSNDVECVANTANPDVLYIN